MANPDEGATTLSGWLKAATMNVGLDALTLDQIPVSLRPKAREVSAYDFEADSKPYPVAVVADGSGAHGSGPAA